MPTITMRLRSDARFDVIFEVVTHPDGDAWEGRTLSAHELPTFITAETGRGRRVEVLPA